MIYAEQNIVNAIVNPVREIKAKVELYSGSTLVETCRCNDRLIKFTIERIGDESKFFGFGICQRMNVHLIDKDRSLNITTANTMKVSFSVDQQNFIYPYPTFYVSEVRRDENTNELSITAYDLMYPDKAHLVSDITLPESYNLLQFANAAASALKATGVVIKNLEDTSSFMLNLEKGGNFNGNETIREALNDIAEATQTIFYINNQNQLVFKRLAKDAAADLTISRENYITLNNRTNRRLGKIYHTTELGDNIHTETAATGTAQYIRENAFWTTFTPAEVAVFLQNALTAIGGLTISQFDCSWRGNFLLEIGDKIGLITKDNDIVHAYVLDDVINYNGALSETTGWSYTNNDDETPSNPTTLGEKLNMTFAKVDKINQEITLVTKEMEDITTEQAGIKITTDSITASVELLGQVADNNTTQIENLSSKLEQTAEDLRLEFKQEVIDGTPNKVTTTTGFTFNEDGLTISKTNSEMSTQITEDGLTIYRGGEEMLIADNEGVYAANLNATTFFIMGDNSRFEDYNNRQRTGCFWIGGV